MGIFDDAGAVVSDVADKVGDAVTAVEGGIADGISGLSDSIGGAISNVESAVGDIAGGIGSALGGIGSAVGGLLSGAAGLLKGLGSIAQVDTTLPIPNPLHAYASYNCLISLGVLSAYSVSDPDNTYMKGRVDTYVFRDASKTPDKRPQTPWGKFEFYADDLEIETAIGAQNSSNNNVVGDIHFKVLEPYSIGMFWNVMQIAAVDAGWKNWRDACYLLEIEFKGNTETGSMVDIPNTNRYIPICFRDLEMNADEKGSTYKCTAYPYNKKALQDQNKNLKLDASVSGTTVLQMLQTGEKSLQSAVNLKLKNIADANGVKTPDRVLILFPLENQSSKDTAKAPTNTDNPTTDENTVPYDKFLSQLGLSESTTLTNSFVQSSGTVNKIGKAKMKFGDDTGGDTPVAKDRVIYDNTGTNIRRGAATTNVKESDMKFSQDSDILNAINQVILMSDFVDQTLDPSQLSPEGYKKWWTIHPQVVPLEHNDQTGETAKLMIYQVVPYDVHIANIPTPGVKPVGLDTTKKGGLRDHIVKEYNYTYTGKNADILKFQIHFNFNFFKEGPASGNSGSADAQTAASQSSGNAPQLQEKPLPPGAPTDGQTGTMPVIWKFFRTMTSTDRLGSGGRETQKTRVGRYFHDYVTTGGDMLNLDMEIIGDPYYIIQTGMGNYVAKSTQYKNLTADGTFNPLNGETHVIINFRNPVDLNQSTGFYDFGQHSSAPISQFSGFYKLLSCKSKISNNKFTQMLHLTRLPNQEAKVSGTKEQMYGTRAVKNPNDPNNKVNTNSNATSSAPATGGADASLANITSGIESITGQLGSAAGQAANLLNQGSAVAGQVKQVIGKLF